MCACCVVYVSVLYFRLFFSVFLSGISLGVTGIRFTSQVNQESNKGKVTMNLEVQGWEFTGANTEYSGEFRVPRETVERCVAKRERERERERETERETERDVGMGHHKVPFVSWGIPSTPARPYGNYRTEGNTPTEAQQNPGLALTAVLGGRPRRWLTILVDELPSAQGECERERERESVRITTKAVTAAM